MVSIYERIPQRSNTFSEMFHTSSFVDISDIYFKRSMLGRSRRTLMSVNYCAMEKNMTTGKFKSLLE